MRELLLTSKSSRHIAEDLCWRIAQGELRPTDMLPGPGKLAEKYEARVGSVQTALSHLRDHGVLTREVGTGSYIAGDVLENPIMGALIDSIALANEMRQRIEKLEGKSPKPD